MPRWGYNSWYKVQRGNYRVSQKFVPLITCDITFDRNYTSVWYFLKTFIALLSTYIRKVISIRYALLCLLSRSEAVAAWSGIRHVPWRAGFPSRLVWAVFSDPSCFRSWVFKDNFIHYAPKILHRVDVWGIWGPACFLYKIWQVFFLHHAWVALAACAGAPSWTNVMWRLELNNFRLSVASFTFLLWRTGFTSFSNVLLM